MADPVVHITGGIPDLGTGNITTLGMLLNTFGSAANSNGVLIAVKSGANAVSLLADSNGNLMGRNADSTGAEILGTTADAAWNGSGSASLCAALKGIYNSVNGPIPAGTSTIGGTLSVLTAANNNLTSTRIVAAATTNANFLKAGAGNVGEIDLFNTAAYTVFFKFFNKASAPTLGTDTPVWTIPIAPGGGYSKSFPRGKYFSTGIAYAITKLQPDNDTTVLVAGDVTGSIDWV